MFKISLALCVLVEIMQMDNVFKTAKIMQGVMYLHAIYGKDLNTQLTTMSLNLRFILKNTFHVNNHASLRLEENYVITSLNEKSSFHPYEISFEDEIKKMKKK